MKSVDGTRKFGVCLLRKTLEQFPQKHSINESVQVEHNNYTESHFDVTRKLLDFTRNNKYLSRLLGSINLKVVRQSKFGKQILSTFYA